MQRALADLDVARVFACVLRGETWTSWIGLAADAATSLSRGAGSTSLESMSVCTDLPKISSSSLRLEKTLPRAPIWFLASPQERLLARGADQVVVEVAVAHVV